MHWTYCKKKTCTLGHINKDLDKNKKVDPNEHKSLLHKAFVKKKNSFQPHFIHKTPSFCTSHWNHSATNLFASSEPVFYISFDLKISVIGTKRGDVLFQ